MYTWVDGPDRFPCIIFILYLYKAPRKGTRFITSVDGWPRVEYLRCGGIKSAPSYCCVFMKGSYEMRSTSGGLVTLGHSLGVPVFEGGLCLVVLS